MEISGQESANLHEHASLREAQALEVVESGIPQMCDLSQHLLWNAFNVHVLGNVCCTLGGDPGDSRKENRLRSQRVNLFIDQAPADCTWHVFKL